MNTEHRDALELRLSHERARLAKAKGESEAALRRVWIAQIEKELAGEPTLISDMTDDELLAELLT